MFIQFSHELTLVLDAPLLNYPHSHLLLPLLNLVEEHLLSLAIGLGLLEPLQNYGLLHELNVSPQVDTEDQPIYHDHLGEKAKSILPHISRAVVKTSNDTSHELQVVMAGDHVGFGEFDENLANLGSAVGGFVMEALVEELEELFFRRIIDNLGVRITGILFKYIEYDVSEDLNDGLPEEVGLAIEEAKQ